MDILILGAAGFIGQHVARRLIAGGHHVIGVDNLEPRVHREMPSIDFPLFNALYWEADHALYNQADVVIHLAAQVGVADSMDDPYRYVRDNTQGTCKLMATLDLAHRSTNLPKRLIVASSMSIYGDPEQELPVAEWKAARPASVYGLTKYDQERLCLMLGQHAGIETIALRFFNVYGQGQALHNPYTGVIANFAQRLLEGKPPIVYEDGEQTRDFIHVEDVARAVAFAATAEMPSSPVLNVCTGKATTVHFMADLLALHLAPDIHPTVTFTERPGDIRHCIGSALLLEQWMGDWKPKSVERGIKEYCEWLKR